MSTAADRDASLGRVLMVAPPDDWLQQGSEWFDAFRPAGVILFRRHLPDRLEAARAAIARLHAWAAAQGRKLLVAADEEGGFVSQVRHLFPVPPSARALAWAAPPAEVRRVTARYAARLRALGLGWSFAPVCDVNDNPRNPVIGVRAFGTAPEQVREHAAAAQAGLHDAGLHSCLKHFPGHGDTDLDSHLTLPVLAHGRERLDRVELVPFRALLAGAPAVMVAHLACPELGDGELPATLSPRVSTELLRRELGFSGVAVTDAMEMEGVAGVFGVGEAAWRALAAGCDLLLYCFALSRVEEARDGLAAALAAGRLSAARLEEAAARVERLAAMARPPAPELPPPAEDARWYKALCGQALRLEAPSAWKRFWQAGEGQTLRLAGWNEEVLLALSQRFEGLGIPTQCAAPEVLADYTAPTLAVLAERRPLGASASAALRRLAGGSGPVALANLLTPEVDAPVAAAFPARLQSADRSDLMLDTVVERCLALRHSS